MKEPCINTQEIHEGDLLAYVWGAAHPETAAHIARCAFCADAVAVLQFLESAFFAAWQRKDCPETDMLLLFQMRMLSAAEWQQVQSHVADCLACQSDVQQFLPASVSPS